MKPKPDSLSLLGTFVKWNPIFVVVVVVVVVVFEKKKGQPCGRQISLGLGLQNRGKNYSATVCSGKGK